MVANHLSRLEIEEKDDGSCIREMFLNEHLMRLELPWYIDFVNYLACRMLTLDISHH